MATQTRKKRLSPADIERLNRMIVPRLCDDYVPHVPHPPQQLFLTLSHYEEVFYGGAAGGGKSDALLMAALQYVDVPGYSALILRRTWPDLTQPGAIMDRATQWLQGTPARMRDGGRVWEFPTSNPELPARLTFGHLQYEKDKYKYQGAELQFVAFDELTQFTQTQYEYLFSRLRRPRLACMVCNQRTRLGHDGVWRHEHNTNTCSVAVVDQGAVTQFSGAKRDGLTLFETPVRMRSASNPGGFGHEWVKARFIDKRTKKKTSIFVPSLLDDNPSVDQEEYLKALSHLGGVEQERLRAGDWDVSEEGGMFKRHWWRYADTEADVKGEITQWVRFWDMAATQNGGDWTVGCLMGITDAGQFLIADVIRDQLSPYGVEQMIERVAEQDGLGVSISMEQEPGSSGVNTIDNYSRKVLAGYDFNGVRSTGAKEVRARPLSSAAEKGNVFLLRGAWNTKFMDEAELFPNGQNDDQVDAAASAMAQLAFGRRARIIV